MADRSYTLINVFGLAIALTAVTLIVAYIRYELAFDGHYSDTYRIVMEDKESLPAKIKAVAPDQLGHILEAEFPEIERVTYFYPQHVEDVLFEANGKQYPYAVLSVDKNFFDVFDLPFMEGGPSSVQNGEDVALTEKAAGELFPEGNAVGKTVERTLYDGSKQSGIVRAIIKDIPNQSHFQGDVLFGRNPQNEQALSFTAYSSTAQYALIKQGVSVAQLEQKIDRFLEKYGKSEKTQVSFIPVTDLHLRTGHIEGMGIDHHDIRFIYIFGFIASLILSIASINYINLSTARSLQRVKEMGMRKVLGAKNAQLRIQVILESFLVFCIAIPIALLLAFLSWPTFSRLLDISDSVAYLLNGANLLAVMVIGIVSAIIAGLYPALILSRRHPVELFKQKVDGIRFSFGPRKTLIVFQFGISILLMVATLVVHGQLQFLNNRPMGFDQDYLLVLPQVHTQTDVLKQELLRIPTVTSVSYAGNATIGTGYGASGNMEDPTDSTKRMEFSFVDADFDFLNTLQIELVQGRYFDASYGADIARIDSMISNRQISSEKRRQLRASKPIVITESTAKRLDITRVDTALYLGALQGTIIGIVKDFRMTSFKEEGPMVVLRGSQRASGNAYVRIARHDIPKTVAEIATLWHDIFPNNTYTYHFADERVQKMYASEDRLALLFSVFSIIAIGISALGLFSLVALMVKQRTKEIGIRKVMGASMLDIAALFSKDFVKLVLLAIILALPLAYWAMNSWLEDYAYRIEVSGWMLAASALAAIAIALVTVNLQAQRAARANPVDSLRDE